MATQMKWRTVWRSVDGDLPEVHRVDHHESRAEAYRYVRDDAANYDAAPSPGRQVTLVFVGGDLGWELHERVDLADYDAWEQ